MCAAVNIHQRGKVGEDRGAGSVEKIRNAHDV
jgi:hypothetical protein